jgi:hypothetical protein
MRKVGIALSAFALAVTLGACGDDGDSGAGDSKPSAELVALTKSIGDQTSEASSAHMRITAEAGDQHINGEGDLKFGDSTAIAMDMSTGAGTVSIVYVDSVLYMKLPQELKPGKPWLKIAPDDKSELAKSLGGLNEQLSKNADPRMALKEFESSGEITAKKNETLDGKQVTHYTITVDVRKMADNQSDPTAQSAMRNAIDSGMQDFPVDVWVDESGLPTRFSLRTPTPNGTGGMTTVTMQVDYTAWGAPVQIGPPPEDQTTAPPA